MSHVPTAITQLNVMTFKLIAIFQKAIKQKRDILLNSVSPFIIQEVGFIPYMFFTDLNYRLLSLYFNI